MASAHAGVEEFRDDDAAYLNWLGAHPDGFVINIQRGLNASDARLHHASCHTIVDEPPRGGPRTGAYMKVCSVSLSDLDDWGIAHAGGSIKACGTCAPPRTAPAGMKPAVKAPRGTDPSAWTDVSGAPRRMGSETRGPDVGRSVVEAWTDHYIQFESGSAEQNSLRAELQQRIATLKPKSGQLLHGTFFGKKHRAADVENLVLYNIDESGAAFDLATRTGLRFELGPDCPLSPAGLEYRFGYRYELVPSTTRFRHWRERRVLAAWGWVDLGAFPDEHRLEQVWFALQQANIDVASPAREPDIPFAVRVAVRAPLSTRPTLARAVKGIVDGVISAFQAHIDTSDITELAARVARNLGAAPEDVHALLTSEQQAALGTQPRLLHRHGEGVQWAPADELCVAGELLAETSSASTWAIKGKIVEVEPA